MMALYVGIKSKGEVNLDKAMVYQANQGKFTSVRSAG